MAARAALRSFSAACCAWNPKTSNGQGGIDETYSASLVKYRPTTVGPPSGKGARGAGLRRTKNLWGDRGKVDLIEGEDQRS